MSDEVRTQQKQRTVSFVGGPWNGVVVAGMDPAGPDSEDDGGYMVTDGTDLRADYAPAPGGDSDTWHFRGMVEV